MSTTNISSSNTSSTTAVFPQTTLAIAIRQSLENMIPTAKIKFQEQELINQKMIVTIEAETPTDESKSVGVRGTFTVPNDLDYIMTAQWEGAINVLSELNCMLNCKRICWEQRGAGYEPRNFQNGSEEILNKGIKILTNAELHELGILSKKYKFVFEIRTLRNNSTLTELRIEGFAHMR